MAKENPWNGNRANRAAQVVGSVVTAVRNLQHPEGCTLNKIVNYISEAAELRAPKRQIVATLKRGLEFGIFRKERGYYYAEPTSENRLMSRLRVGLADGFGRRRRETKIRRKPGYPRDRKLSFKKTERRKSTAPGKTYRLSDMYHNPNYKMSTASSYLQLGETVCN